MKWLPQPRALFALSLIVPCALVAFAVMLTTVYQVAACPLCIVQRMLYLVIAVAALFGAALASEPGVRVFAALLQMIIAAAGAAIAGYQIYLQQHPFSASCGDGSSWWERLVEQAGQLIPLLFKAEGLCSESTWPLFGISIVEWSALAFAGLFIFGLMTLFAQSRR